MLKPVDKVLVLHCHTTGVNYGDDVTLNQQPLSIALGVFDMKTLKLVDHVNVMVAFNPEKYNWNDKLVSIHGISKDEALEGEDISDAAAICAEFIYNNFGTKEPVPVMGYNPLSFHVPFLQKVLKTEDLNFKFNQRDVDLYAIGTLANAHTMKELFETFEIDQTEPLSSLYIIKSFAKIYRYMTTILRESLNV